MEDLWLRKPIAACAQTTQPLAVLSAAAQERASKHVMTTTKLASIKTVIDATSALHRAGHATQARRIFASLLITATTKDKGVTYFNISALPHTWPTMEAQGFSVYCRGQMYPIPVLRRAVKSARMEIFEDKKESFDEPDREVLKQYSAIGGLSLILRHNSESYPFAFQRHYVKRTVPVFRLAYYRDIEEFIRFAGNLGRFLLKVPSEMRLELGVAHSPVT